MFDRMLFSKGEPKAKVINNEQHILQNESLLIAHNGSGFDSWPILNNLPKGRKLLIIVKNGKGIISLKIHNGDIKGKPQYTTFTCSRTHLNKSSKNLMKLLIYNKNSWRKK